MSAIFVPTLYAMSGISAFAALHHGLAVAQRRVSQNHLLFAALCLAIMALILAKAGAYQAQTVLALVSLRKVEISAVCVFFMIFPWFVAGYTGVRPRRFLLGLTLFWCVIFAANLGIPHGIQYTGMPRLTYFELPWGERVVDLRVLQRSLWHQAGVLGILVVMAFSAHACVVHYRRGQQKRARALAWVLGLFFGSILFNFAVNLGLVAFLHLSELGFLAMLVMMDMAMTLESRDQRRRMRAVLDHLPAAICLKDMKGRLQLVNRGYENFFHVSDTEILGRTDQDLFPPEQAERFRADERLAVETGQEVEKQHVLERDGEPRIYQTHQFPLLRADGSAYAVCGVYLDITESRKKDEALRKFRQQVWHTDRVASTGAISASLAHEICQPLAAILNNAQAGLRFLAQDGVDLEEIRDILQDIVRDDKRAGTIINGLRAMLQQQETPQADIDVAQSIEEVLELLHSELIGHGVEVGRALEANLSVRANKTQIQQVVLNLVINAMEAMAEQPAGRRTLQIRAERDQGKARVSILDAGVGIAEDMLGKIFEGFYTTKPKGLGIGLEVCRSILETHQGSIWAEANPEGGAIFRFTLPLAGASTAADAKANA